ncbi:MAG: ArsR family transcriptional regulator [Planctomycetota bacterium]|nr:MAG: ArsR family transcriptional regulator [Planctomycetota bacterium]
MTSKAINRMFRAFSDPIRLRILHLLQEGEMCVGDLVEVLQVPQPTASRHLRYLRQADLVVSRRQGRWCFYSLAEAGSAFHQKLLSCLGSCFFEVPTLQEDATRAKALRQAGGCCPSVPCS